MYGDNRRSRTSWTPPRDHPILESTPADTDIGQLHRDSLLTTESSELPYTSDAVEKFKPPRPPRAAHPGSARPSTAPHDVSLAENGFRPLAPSNNRRSLPLPNDPHKSVQGELPPRIKSTPPIPLDSPLPPPPALEEPDVLSSTEDSDAYYVRNVYAQLDSVGVPGDGYEDGIERTRARLHASTDPVTTPAAASNLTAAELELLSRVDRSVLVFKVIATSSCVIF